MDSMRRTILATGAAATAVAAVARVLAQQTGGGAFYEKGPVCIHFEDTGSGFPLLLIPGGGLNSSIANFTRNSPFNPIEEFKGEYRCITADLRNANGGQSTGQLEIDRPWDAYADDQLGVMDHLGVGKFMVMGRPKASAHCSKLKHYSAPYPCAQGGEPAAGGETGIARGQRKLTLRLAET